MPTEEFIVVAPQLLTRGDFWHRHADPVQEIVRQIHEVHQGDPHRTCLTGFSFGGNGVFDLALEQPDFWSALWPVDPTRLPEEDPGRPVWLSGGQVSRHLGPDFIDALELEPFDEGRAGERIYTDQGEDHVGTARLAYQDERIYRWLLSKQLPAAGGGAGKRTGPGR